MPGWRWPSLVVHRREGNITVSDLHPLSRCFLDENLRLNALGPLEHHAGNWGANTGLGEFDLIIGSDVLYERAHPALLAAFISRHSAAEVNVIIIDPDRGNRPRFCREMDLLGYACSQRRAARTLENGAPYKGSVLRFGRSTRITSP